MIKQSSFRQYLEATTNFLAIAAPIICLFDCVVLPIVSALLPFIGLHHLIHGISDQLATALVMGLCLPVMIPGIIKHRNTSVFIMFSSAASLMFFTNLVGEHIDAALHIALTVATSVLLLRANWLNKRLLSCVCSHHNHTHPRTQAQPMDNQERR